MGSSPQVRGRPRSRALRLTRVGLIPAGAGQTNSFCCSICCCRAHPRRCGADAISFCKPCTFGGSSPQVRGRRWGCDVEGGYAGLIPAGAGQTRAWDCLPSKHWAHPRRCGADPKGSISIPTDLGSSPQVRGRLAEVPERAVQVGLIPAGAGQTIGHILPAGERWAHPRRCGADGAVLAHVRMSPGSSPQVRGRLCTNSTGQHLAGLIPAGAGQTSLPMGKCRFCWAHPRRCGADVTLYHADCREGGSSPQVRGRPHPPHHR